MSCRYYISHKPKMQTKNISAKRKKTILIVEDYDVSSKYFKVILNKFNFNTILAVNGKEAVDLCKQRQDIDLVLMDIKLPIMNGYQATKKIKAIRSDIPIIAQTAFALLGDRDKAIKAGCDDYLPKPVTSKKLKNIIDKHIA